MEEILKLLESQIVNQTPQENVIYQAFLFGISNWLFECEDHKIIMPTTVEDLIISCDAFFVKYLMPNIKTFLETLFEAIARVQPHLTPSEFLSETYPLLYDPDYDIFQELEKSDILSEEFKKQLSAKLENQTSLDSSTPTSLLKRNHYKKTRRLTGHRAITPIQRKGRRVKTLKHRV